MLRHFVSQKAGLPEGEISASLRVGFQVSDNDVIKQVDLRNLVGFAQRAGQVDVRSKTSRFWVIMAST
jgi:hypothetical protein